MPHATILKALGLLVVSGLGLDDLEFWPIGPQRPTQSLSASFEYDLASLKQHSSCRNGLAAVCASCIYLVRLRGVALGILASQCEREQKLYSHIAYTDKKSERLSRLSGREKPTADSSDAAART